jgi:hypothetical protein
MFHVERIGMPIDSIIGIPIFCVPVTYDELIAHYGTQRAAGDALKVFDGIGVKQPSVAEWKEQGIPAPRQAQYEVVTGGALRADRVDPQPVQLVLPATT